MWVLNSKVASNLRSTGRCEHWDTPVEDNRIETYWQRFLDSLPPDSPVRDERYVAESWGDSPQMADELGALISAGTKTATCSALWEYEAEGESLPEIGLKTIVLDGNGDPMCIVETTEVEVWPYDEVDSRFAYEEGEGDRCPFLFPVICRPLLLFFHSSPSCSPSSLPCVCV